MTVYFQGTEHGDFEALSAGVSVNSATTAARNTSNTRMALTINTTPSALITSKSFSASSFWFHGVHYHDNDATSASNWINFMSSGQAVIRCRSTTNANEIDVQTWNGSAFVSQGIMSAGHIFQSTKAAIDIKIVLGASGSIALYVNGVVKVSLTGLSINYGAIDQVILGKINNSASGNQMWTEIIVASFCTIGSKLVARVLDANGNYTAWTGAGYTALDEATAPAADYMTSASADQRASYSAAAFPALVGAEAIASVQIGAWLNRGATGPQNANMFVRVSSTDYDASDQALSLTAKGMIERWELNPNTGAVWTVAQIDGAEWGIRSRT